MDKATFLSRLQKERDVFEWTLNRVGSAKQIAMPGVWGGLSVKDLLADVLSRELFFSDRLSEILHGEPYSPCVSHSALHRFEQKFGYPDYESRLVESDAPNHLFVYKHKNVGMEELAAQEIAAYLGVFEALEKLPRAACLDFDVFRRAEEHTCRPYRRMIQKINRWRESILPGAK